MSTVLLSVNAEDIAEKAQVAFVDGNSWTVFGPFCRFQGLTAFSPMPAVSCPVIDISNILDQDDLISMVVRRHINQSGVLHLDALVADMVALGASVS
jgi:hypothetical protein